MEPTVLPASAQSSLDAVIATLLGSLATIPQDEAVCHQQLDDPERPMESAVTGSMLQAEPFRPPIDIDERACLAAFRAVFLASKDAGLTVRQIEVRFRRENKIWKHEISVESAADHQRLQAARRKVDPQIGAALVAFANEARAEWPKVSLSWDWRTDSRNPGLNVILPYPRPVTTMAPSPTLRSLFEHVQKLHTNAGGSLYTASWHVDSAKPRKVDVMTYYG